MILQNDCSFQCLKAVQQFFTRKGFVITSLSEHLGKDNKTYGDAAYKLIDKDGNEKIVNIDFKRQMKDRDFIAIELIYVKMNGEYDGWLYNPNEHYIVYEFNNGDVFVFSHEELIGISKYFNREDVWQTCMVYTRNPNAYFNERLYISNKLNEYDDVSPICIEGNISSSDIHINGAFNYTNYGNRRSPDFTLRGQILLLRY